MKWMNEVTKTFVVVENEISLNAGPDQRRALLHSRDQRCYR